MIRIDVKKLEQNIDHAAALLKVLANEQRLKIVCVLYYGEKCVSELGVITGLRQSALSQHLARLRREGLVETRRDAQTIYYSLNKQVRNEMLHSLYEFYDTGEVVSA
jgi:DNA-binding transcriptional ArsR family regulator